MTESHQRILMDTELLIAARQGDESRFACILGFEEDISEITINTDNRCIARDEPDFFLGVTYTGNSLLHLAARSNFLDIAEKIWRRETSLLVARNKVLETPLHCAAKNGNTEMVSLFVGFANEMGEDIVKRVLRARNKDGETALHEAARHNHAAVASLLITADPGLASVMDHQGEGETQGEGERERQKQRETEKEREKEKTGSCFHTQGISPLYLATTSGNLDVVQEMIDGLIGTEVSRAYYAGPDGQTALHAAVLRSKEMTEKLLRWKPLLARMPDNSGSTPLHFAASYGYDKIVQVLLKFDHSLAYLHDSCGSFPVHVAGKMGHVGVIRAIMDHCPDSDELLDAKGRNFLHVAARKRQYYVVKLICGTTSTHKSMKNARDNDGNTPLHLAMDSRGGRRLMQDKEVSLNFCNKKGLTLRDQSAIVTFNDNAIYPLFQKVNFGMEKSTEMVGAYYGTRRWDQFVDDHTTKVDAEKENKKLTTTIQTLGLGSVLIATATFAAAFTIPGGYRADDHPKSGSPTLAEKYAFKAFLASDIIAFLFAFHSTMLLLFRGVTSSNPHSKKYFVSLALWCITLASRCTLISFALAIFVVIAPVNKYLGILVLIPIIEVAFMFSYYGVSRDYLFIKMTISKRKYWGKLLQNKLPEDTLRQGLSAWWRYAFTFIVYYTYMMFPIVITALGPFFVHR